MNKADIDSMEFSNEFRQKLGSMIAHELKTPLVTINSSSKAIKVYVDKLLDIYNDAKSSGIDLRGLNEKNLMLFKCCVDNIEIESRVADFLTYLISSIVKLQGKNPVKEMMNARELVGKAIIKIPETLYSKNKQVIISNRIDEAVNIKVLKQPVIALFCSVIYNAILRSPVDKSVSVSIEAEESEKETRILFIDNIEVTTSTGVVFEENGELKPELFFCHELMSKVDGKFELQEKKGKYIKTVTFYKD